MSAEKEDLLPRNLKPNVGRFSLFWLPFVFTFQLPFSFDPF